MKIRNGFVSNSSSSSFILIGKKVNIADITCGDIKKKTYVCIGKELGDGDDIFYIDSKKYLFFLKSAAKLSVQGQYFEGFKIYETFRINDDVDEDEITFNSKDLPKGQLVSSSYWKDYSSSRDVGDLFDKYLYDIYDSTEFKTIYNRLLRKEKLENINKNES